MERHFEIASERNGGTTSVSSAVGQRARARTAKDVTSRFDPDDTEVVPPLRSKQFIASLGGARASALAHENFGRGTRGGGPSTTEEAAGVIRGIELAMDGGTTSVSSGSKWLMTTSGGARASALAHENFGHCPRRRWTLHF